MNPTDHSRQPASSLLGATRACAGQALACLALAASALALCAQPAAAQATYQYQGNPFTLFSCGPNSDNTATMDCSTPSPTNQFTTYKATDFVAATLTLDAALPANLALQDIRARPGFALSMNDGEHTVTNAMAVGLAVEVATDASGQIVQWRLVLNTGGVSNGGIATINSGTSILDSGTIACCDPTVQGNLALNFGPPGLWNAGGATNPAAAVTNLISLLSNPLLGLSGGQVSSLTDKLNSALASIQAGLNKQAINQLGSFINSVQSSQKTGKMSGQTATTLTSAANAIIATL